MQSTNQYRWLEFVDCYDTESEACEIDYRSTIGRRFLVKAVLEEDRMGQHPRPEIVSVQYFKSCTYFVVS